MLFRLIKGEIPEQTMPTVYSVLEDDEVWKILAFIRSVCAGHPGRIDWQEAPALVRKPDEVRVVGLSLLW